MKWFITCALLFFSNIGISKSDIYLHNPRGSNNRCDERTNDRTNANRLFDSQNNGAGGYAVPCQDTDLACFDMNYYTASYLDIRFTTQHACGIQNQCEIILQYGCDTPVRNGEPLNALGNTCTRTIPDIYNNGTLLNDQSYGYHESYESYQACKLRPRNTNLYTADQVLGGLSALYTRQNPNGQRYGFECPEERDYYPYWAPTMWQDIAVMTSNSSSCDYYLNQTKTPTMICTNINNTAVNRLGATYEGRSESSFRWQLPTLPAQNCVLRIRYNISLPSDLDWFADKSSNLLHQTDPPIEVNGRYVRLALSTDQLSRTFEDRSYTFNIVARPTHVRTEDKIYNINVQGKRGNIAQVRNCFEYDFVPNNLTITEEDYVHFQWVGSDFNPQNNDGEGRAGTDRSNLVEIIDFMGYNRVMNNSFLPNDLIDHFTYLGQLNENCFNVTELILQRQIKNTQSLRNCALLNNASVYFNSRLFKINISANINITNITNITNVTNVTNVTNKTYNYMSTRNNNFSNRNQKGTLLVLKIINISHNSTNSTNLNNQNNANSSVNNNLNMPIIAIVFIVLFVVAFISIISMYVYRNHSKMRKYIVRSVRTQV